MSFEFVRSLGLRRLEKLWLHVYLAEFRYATAQLEQRLYTIQDTHMGKSDFSDELQLRVFRQSRDRLSDSKHGADDVMRGVS